MLKYHKVDEFIVKASGMIIKLIRNNKYDAVKHIMAEVCNTLISSHAKPTGHVEYLNIVLPPFFNNYTDYIIHKGDLKVEVFEEMIEGKVNFYKKKSRDTIYEHRHKKLTTTEIQEFADLKEAINSGEKVVLTRDAYEKLKQDKSSGVYTRDNY